MALAIATLPASVALRRYGGKILQYVHDDVETHGLLIADGDDVMSPLCKLEVLPARSGNGLVHIRCSYNNKFLGEKAIPWWRRWLSNLWRMNQHGDAPSTSPFYPIKKKNQPFLQFSSAVDKWHPSVLQEVENDFYGYADNWFRTKCHSSNVRDGYWRRNRDSDPEWIHADSVLLPHHSPVSHRWGDNIFRAAKVGESAEGIIVAFRSTNDNYLMRGSANNVQNVLRVTASTTIPKARFLLEELVRSRLIYNVNFNLLDARIYSNEPELVTGQSFNNVTSLPQNMELTYTYTLSKSTSTWNATVSTTVGVSTTFRTGVPFIAHSEISTSLETTTTYEWGRSYTEDETRTDTIAITLPPMSGVTVSRIETRGSCDVPFSYTQEDTLYNWEKKEYQKHDGLYRGVNSFNIHYQAIEEPLPSSSDPNRETKTYPVFPTTSRLVSSVPAA
ncbi:hypothetical protein ACLB2K_056028 [Fragaria x ananassa]